MHALNDISKTRTRWWGGRASQYPSRFTGRVVLVRLPIPESESVTPIFDFTWLFSFEIESAPTQGAMLTG